MKDQTIVCLAIGAAGIGALIWYAQKDPEASKIVPQVQGEQQMMGLGLQATMRVNAGTPLDMRQENHGWHPGYDPDPSAQPVTQCAHRYPAVPGGNISTVIHQGWSGVANKAPAGNEWMITPPEAATL
jgi:hypothetical protein